MARFLPISLSGDNLGQRHRYFNSQVIQAATELVTFQDIENLPEQAPIDRLFKIDLANKLKNVEYILKNIKNDDMLYVSRALKCKWLLERRDIINPKYLEDVLYPEMVIPAISKMKHWLYINLRNPLMCQEFYKYYKETKINYALKFLNECGEEFLLNEFPKILTKITPHYLKVFGEKCPKLVKIYYESMATDNDLVRRYRQEEQVFYNNIKCLLKLDTDIFLDITEKYHSLTDWNRLSSTATEYILRFHKSRFVAKPELYVLHLLDMPTVAQCLSSEECQDLVIKLARADYLQWWFSYANVEPLVKRVSKDKIAAFKKRVFVEKAIGGHVAEWPYTLPAHPVAHDINFEKPHIFDDLEFEPITMLPRVMKRLVKKRKGGRCDYMIKESGCRPVKSELQKLFDQFRFVGFEGTLHELKRKVRTMSSADRRRDILIVLVSKSGGRDDAVRVLLQLALTLRNEPVHVRAAVIRSLVKRASAWRLPQDVWDTMLEYGRGLGLDGTKAEAKCREGLHAVVMRQLIATGDCEPSVRAAFLEEFSTFSEYKLVKSERVQIGAGLQKILITAAAGAEPTEAANYLEELLNVLKEFHIRVDSSPVLSAITALAERDLEAAIPLLERLYNARVGRRELLRQNLKFRHDDTALLNALRHDPGALESKWLVELLFDGETRATQTLLKLAVYFYETGGCAEQIRQELLEKIAENPAEKLARPLAMLAGSDISLIWQEHDVEAGEHRKLAAALRANMHRARPAPDALALGWRKAGMKAVAWRAKRCRPVQVKQLVQSLLEQREKRTVRLALALAQHTDCAVDIFSTAITIRPLAALRAALLNFQSLGDTANLKIWDIVKSFILTVDLGPREGLRYILRKVEVVPKSIKPDYCAILSLALDKLSDRAADYVLSEIMKLLPEVDDDLLENVLLRVLANMDTENPKSYPAIVVRYLLLSKDDDILKTRFDKIGEPFFNKLDAFRDGTVTLRHHFFLNNFHQIISSLQYNTAFFDINYECCLTVIERVLTWMQSFMPKDMYFDDYVKIHATMLYYKAVRQSIKHKPEIFNDPAKKMCEGVEVVGVTLGKYMAKEVSELISNYFDSIIEIYRNTLVDYLNNSFMHGSLREKFTVAIVRGILSESVGKETRLIVQVLKTCQYDTEGSVAEEIKELIKKSDDKETQFFLHAEIIV